MELFNKLIAIVVIIAFTFPVFSQTSQWPFRVVDPANPNANYGKSPYSINGSFLYFNTKDQQYNFASSRYDNFIYAVEAAFQSWNNVCKVQFSQGTGGVTLAESNLDDYNPGTVYIPDTYNHNTNELTPSTATIKLGSEDRYVFTQFHFCMG
jgi:hypothetical protein